MDVNRLISAIGQAGIAAGPAGGAHLADLPSAAGAGVGRGVMTARRKAAPPGIRRRSAGDTGERLLVRAMIAAAGADGHIDPEERRRILKRLDALALSAEEKRLLLDELMRPLTLQEIAEEARKAGAAEEVYAASFLTVDASRPEGRVYLQNLAEILALPVLRVRRIQEASGDPRRKQPDEAA